MAILGVDIPELELAVSAGGDKVFGVEELDVGHGLLVAFEHAQGGLGVAEVVIVDAMVGGSKNGKKIHG